MNSTEIARLLSLLGASNAQLFRLHMLELTGYLLLMLHWQRGIVDMLIQIRKVRLSKAQRENWDRVIKNLEAYEALAWDIAPPRAILPLLAQFRTTNELPEQLELFSTKDEHGRVPYGQQNLDIIEDLLRRIQDCKVFEDNECQV